MNTANGSARGIHEANRSMTSTDTEVVNATRDETRNKAPAKRAATEKKAMLGEKAADAQGKGKKQTACFGRCQPSEDWTWRENECSVCKAESHRRLRVGLQLLWPDDVPRLLAQEINARIGTDRADKDDKGEARSRRERQRGRREGGEEASGSVVANTRVGNLTMMCTKLSEAGANVEEQRKEQQHLVLFS